MGGPRMNAATRKAGRTGITSAPRRSHDRAMGGLLRRIVFLAVIATALAVPFGGAAFAAPASVAAPAVLDDGTPADGELLSAANGTWSTAPTSFAYQWLRCDAAGGACAAISGPTAAGYRLAPADNRGTRRRAARRRPQRLRPPGHVHGRNDAGRRRPRRRPERCDGVQLGPRRRPGRRQLGVHEWVHARSLGQGQRGPDRPGHRGQVAL